MKTILSIAIFIFLSHTGDAFAHGKSGAAGEWLPIVKTTDIGDLTAQIQSSPLGNEILLAYSGEGVLEVLAEDGKAFLRISDKGVQGNLDHSAWYRSQVAGERPLPETATDSIDAPDWRTVSDKTYWGWYDKRLQKQDDHQDNWQIALKINGEKSAINGEFKSLVPPEYRTLVTLDKQSITQIEDLSAILINGVEPAIRFSYKGDNELTIFDDSGQAMLKLNRNGVHAKVASPGWQQLSRLPLSSPLEWVNISHQPAYTWPDNRLTEANSSGTWSIPVQINNEERYLAIVGSWMRIKSVQEAQYTANR